MIGSIRSRAERVALLGLVFSTGAVFVLWYVARNCQSLAARAEIFHLLAAALIWGISFLHLRARRMAAEERESLQEAERLREAQGRQRLFDAEGGEAGIAQTRLKEMEKYGAPLASALIVLVQLIFGGLFLYGLAYLGSKPEIGGMLGMPATPELTDAAFGAAVSFAVAFGMFALGMYAAGMARDGSVRILRAGAGYSVGVALACALLTLAFGLGYSGWVAGERALAWVLPIGYLLISVEMLVNFLLDFYRPRTRGEEARPIYDGRLTGLLAEPQGLFRTFAHTLDYQFGFHVSETWFFRFLNRAIAPLILFQLAALYLLTSIVIVQPGEVAVIERWGRPRGVDRLPPAPRPGAAAAARDEKEAAWDALDHYCGPGFYLKWPWPVETVRRVPLRVVQEIQLGAPQKTKAEQAAWERQRGRMAQVITWDTEHTEDEYKYVMPLVSASFVNVKLDGLEDDGESEKAPDAMFVSGRIELHYTVGRPKADGSGVRTGDIYRYLYRFKDPRQALVAIGERELTSYFAGEDFWDVLVDELPEKEVELRARMQRAVDKAGLGVHIIFVSLSNMHPPVGEVGKAYQEVISAREEMQTKIHTARAEAAEVMADAPGESVKLVLGAQGYHDERVLVAEARAKRFRNQLEAYAAAPEVYLHRERMRILDEALPQVGKLSIVPPGVVAAVDTRQDGTAGLVGRALGDEINTER